MAKKLTFEVRREMSGDRDYKTGETRELLALDAIHLVKSGALKPQGEEAEKVMAEYIQATPDNRSGVVQQVKKDAPRNKDMGGAPINKGGRKKGAASPPPPAGPATGTGSGDDGQGGQGDASAQGGAGGEGDAGGQADTSAQGGQAGAPGVVPPVTGKRR